MSAALGCTSAEACKIIGTGSLRREQCAAKVFPWAECRLIRGNIQTRLQKLKDGEYDAILLAKAVDGIYDSDPKVNPDAKKYDEISIDEVVAKKLAAMDLTASIMCMEQKMPMLVFGLDEKDSIVNTVHGKFSGTKVTV